MDLRNYEFLPVRYATRQTVLADGSHVSLLQLPSYLSDFPGGFFIGDIESIDGARDSDGKPVLVVQLQDGPRSALSGTVEDFRNSIAALGLDFENYRHLFKV